MGRRLGVAALFAVLLSSGIAFAGFDNLAPAQPQPAAGALQPGLAVNYLEIKARSVDEVEAEGEAGAIERFERALRHGPPGARVDEVDVEAGVPHGRETGFFVK